VGDITNRKHRPRHVRRVWEDDQAGPNAFMEEIADPVQVDPTVRADLDHRFDDSGPRQRGNGATDRVVVESRANDAVTRRQDSEDRRVQRIRRVGLEDDSAGISLDTEETREEVATSQSESPGGERPPVPGTTGCRTDIREIC